MFLSRCTFIYMIVLVSTIVSCSGNPESNATNDIDYFQFQQVDLNRFDLPVKIYLPDASAGIGTAFKPEILHEEGGYKWQLSVGRYFKLFIEDYGNQRFLFEEKFDEIKNNKVYKTAIKKRDGSIIIYTKQLNGKLSNNKSGMYFIFAVVQIDGYYYQITNRQEGNTKKEIDFMYKSIKSIKEI